MLAQLLLMILETLLGFLAFALLARFALQWARVSFRNPLGQFVVAITDWAVRPARRVVPGLFGIDLSCLVLAWLTQVVHLAIAALLLGLPAAPVAVLLLAMLETLKVFVWLLIGATIVSAIFSWINPYAPMAGVFDALVRPLLAPFRRLIPPVGGVDLTPVALLLLLQVALFLIGWLRMAVAPLLA